MLNSNEKYIIFYDPECPLCERFKKALNYIDNSKVITFKSIHDPEVFEQFPELSKEACFDEVHMMNSKKKIFKGGEVITELLTLFPGVSKLSWLIEKESSQKAADFFYKSLNNIRKSLKSDCPKCNRSKK